MFYLFNMNMRLLNSSRWWMWARAWEWRCISWGLFWGRFRTRKYHWPASRTGWRTALSHPKSEQHHLKQYFEGIQHQIYSPWLLYFGHSVTSQNTLNTNRLKTKITSFWALCCSFVNDNWIFTRFFLSNFVIKVGWSFHHATICVQDFLPITFQDRKNKVKTTNKCVQHFRLVLMVKFCSHFWQNEMFKWINVNIKKTLPIWENQGDF